MRFILYRAFAPRPRVEIVSRRVEREGNATDPGSRHYQLG
jgi:hypothetical protein